MPINLTSNKYPFKLGNNATLGSIKLPTNIEGCIPRLWETKTSSNKLKNSGDYMFLSFFVYMVFKMFPNRLAAYLAKKFVNNNTLIAATLGAGDASLSTVTLCNKNVKDIIFFYPTVCNVGISFSIITYGDEIRMALTIDSDIIEKPEFILEEFINQVDDLNRIQTLI